MTNNAGNQKTSARLRHPVVCQPQGVDVGSHGGSVGMWLGARGQRIVGPRTPDMPSVRMIFWKKVIDLKIRLLKALFHLTIADLACPGVQSPQRMQRLVSQSAYILVNKRPCLRPCKVSFLRCLYFAIDVLRRPRWTVTTPHPCGAGPRSDQIVQASPLTGTPRGWH